MMGFGFWVLGALSIVKTRAVPNMVDDINPALPTIRTIP